MPEIQVSVGKSQSEVVVWPLAAGQMWRDSWGRSNMPSIPTLISPQTELNWSEVSAGKLPARTAMWTESPYEACQYSRLLMSHLYSIDWIQAYKFTQSSQICTCVPIPAFLPHPPSFSINYIRVCIYCGNASGPSAGNKRNTKWFSRWFTWEKYTIWKPALTILISIENKIRQKIKRRALETLGRSSVSKNEMKYKSFTLTIVVSIQIYE